MTTATRNDSRSRIATALEIAMVGLGLVIGATFFSSLWTEPTQANLQALVGPAAPAPTRS